MMPRFSRYGGAEGFAFRLAESLAKAGHQVDFICARCETEPPAHVRPIVVGRFGPFRWVKILWFACAAEYMRRRGQYALSIGLGKTFQQDVLRIGGGALSIFWKLSAKAWDKGWQRKWKMLRRYLSPANWINLWIEYVQLKKSTHIVVNSSLLKDWLIEAHPYLTQKNIDIIFNRPNLTRFTPFSEKKRNELRKAAGIKNNEIVLLTAGTNFRLKGIRTLIHALTQLPKHYKLIVAGARGCESYLALAQKLGVKERIQFIGRVDDMCSFYNTGDIFILASFYDACSNAVMEALACGLKTVSSACNGSACFLEQECILTDPADHIQLASILQGLEQNTVPKSFEWPAEISAGMDAWITYINTLLIEKTQKSSS